MKRYLITSLTIGVSVFALICSILLLGGFQAVGKWIEELYVSRGLMGAEGIVRVYWFEILVMLAASMGVSWSIIDVSQVAQKIMVAFFVFLLVLGISPTMAMYNILFDPTAPLLAVVLSSVAAFVYSGSEPGMRKRVLEDTLGSRVSVKVFRRLLEAKEPMSFSGATRNVTVVTCRLFGHVELREKLDPAEFTKLSNLFLRSVSTFLLSRGAYLDESGPDVVRVFFGMLEDTDDHANEACKAALELKSRLKSLSQESETRWFQKLQFGIGIASGPATVGIYGAQQEFFFSGIGTDTEYSRRLSIANLRYGSHILLGPETYELVEEAFEFRPMEMYYDPETDRLREMYELIGAKENFSDEAREKRDLFWKGVIFMRERKYEEALDVLSRAKTPGVVDSPLEFFLSKAQEGISSPEGSEASKIKEFTEDGHARLISSM